MMLLIDFLGAAAGGMYAAGGAALGIEGAEKAPETVAPPPPWRMRVYSLGPCMTGAAFWLLPGAE